MQYSIQEHYPGYDRIGKSTIHNRSMICAVQSQVNSVEIGRMHQTLAGIRFHLKTPSGRLTFPLDFFTLRAISEV